MTENLQPDPGFCTKTAWIQIGYGLWVSLTMVGIGLAFGFPAVTIPQLNDKESTILITTTTEGWIASVLTLVAPVGNIVCGYLMDKYGRRIILIVCELPLCVGWLYTGFSTTAWDIIIGRLITGVGIGMAVGAPRIYVTEISLPNMRGTVGALPNLAMSLGLTTQAVFGAYMNWQTICYVCAGYSFLLLLVNILLPETPYFVLLNGTVDNAVNTLKKFRSSSYQTNREMNDMVEYKVVNDIRRITFKEELYLLFTKAACKPFWIIFMYMFLSQISGVSVIFMWTIELIQASKSSVDANLGNFLMGLTRTLTGVISSLLLYRIGRKPQALISSVGVGVMFIALGSMMHAKTSPSVYPVIAYVFVAMFATLGYYSLPLLIMYELYPLKIRGLLGGISVSMLNISIFSVNKLYPYLRNWIGHKNVILCFGISSLLGSIYLYFYLPETKGLSLQEIEEYFNDLRPTLVSQRNVIAAQLSQGFGSDRSSVRSQLSLKRSKTSSQKVGTQLRKKKKDEALATTSTPNVNENQKNNDGGEKNTRN